MARWKSIFLYEIEPCINKAPDDDDDDDDGCRGNKQLVNHFIMNVPGVVVVCIKRSGIRLFFQCKRLRIPIL